MRQVRLTVVFLLVFQAPMFGVQDWTLAVEKLTKATVYIESKGGSCTGFVVRTIERDGDKLTQVMTAAHCLGGELYADQTPAEVVFRDTKKDLAVIEVEDLKRPSLSLAPNDPKVGDVVASYGFGYSLERPMFRVAHISDDKSFIAEAASGPLFVIDAAFVPGMSGGPVVNQLGEVVMVVQMASDRVGLGIGVEALRAKAGRFFAK